MIGRIPTDGLVLHVHDLVVGVEQFNPVAVGIAEVNVHGMPRAMTAGPALDLAAEP